LIEAKKGMIWTNRSHSGIEGMVVRLLQKVLNRESSVEKVLAHFDEAQAQNPPKKHSRCHSSILIMPLLIGQDENSIASKS
jgi:hypothetical protein